MFTIANTQNSIQESQDRINQIINDNQDKYTHISEELNKAKQMDKGSTFHILTGFGIAFPMTCLGATLLVKSQENISYLQSYLMDSGFSESLASNLTLGSFLAIAATATASYMLGTNGLEKKDLAADIFDDAVNSLNYEEKNIAGITQKEIDRTQFDKVSSKIDNLRKQFNNSQQKNSLKFDK